MKKIRCFIIFLLFHFSHNSYSQHPTFLDKVASDLLKNIINSQSVCSGDKTYKNKSDGSMVLTNTGIERLQEFNNGCIPPLNKPPTQQEINRHIDKFIKLKIVKTLLDFL